MPAKKHMINPKKGRELLVEHIKSVEFGMSREGQESQDEKE
jgi:hypothetical protein